MSDKFEKPKFKSEFTNKQSLEFEQAAQDHAIRRRTALSILTKSSDELMAIAKDNPNILMDMHDEIKTGQEAYQSLVDMMDTANMRILATCGYGLQEGAISGE